MTVKSPVGALLLATIVASMGCGAKGKQDVSQDKTAELLLSCKQERDRLKLASDMCTKQLDDARAKPAATELTVRLEGDILKVYGDLRGASMATEDATALSDSVISQVRASRQGLQQCYVAAMKADSAIQARTIQGKMVVQVGKSGSVKSTAFTPAISATFAGCIRKVASRWKVPAYSEDRTIEVPVTLQPG